MRTYAKQFLTSLAAGGLILLASCNNNSPSPDATSAAAPAATAHSLSEPVPTKSGMISGTAGKVAGVTAFKGIPFGAPPVGQLRWQPPQAVTAWQGVRAGDQFGPVCMQLPAPQRVPHNVSIEQPDSPPVKEDCLYLNVWTPATTSAAKLPVMVWIFGGAYTEGAGSSPHNQGDQLAAKGVIVVSFNYRLGSLGFLAHPELTKESPHGASGNYALLDSIAALQWVQDNIAAFGGDPSNVTIFGESAGSAMSAALVGMPLSKGLFQKAISESGTWMGLSLGAMKTRESVEQQVVDAAAKLGVMDLAGLRAMSAEDALAKLPKPGMIVDGWAVPEDLSVTFAQGHQLPIDVLVGSNHDEGSFSAGFGPPMTAQKWADSAAQRWGDLAPMGLAAYPAKTDAEAAANNTQIFTDNMAWLMRQYAASQRKIGKHAYVYHFIHVPPTAEGTRKLGVCHTCEIQYVFNNLNVPRVYPDASSPELALASPVDVKVADMTSSYWVNFAKKGDPNGEGLAQWPMFEDIANGPVMQLGENSAVGDSLGAAKVALYQAMYDKQMGIPSQKVEDTKTSDLKCYEIGYRYGHTATTAMANKKVNPSWDIVVPERCRNQSDTNNGIKAGSQAASK